MLLNRKYFTFYCHGFKCEPQPCYRFLNIVFNSRWIAIIIIIIIIIIIFAIIVGNKYNSYITYLLPYYRKSTANFVKKLVKSFYLQILNI